jgi:hypothetical protein
MRAPIPEITPLRAAGSPRRRKRPAGQASKEKDYLWRDFWDDPAVRKSLRRILLKAYRKLVERGSKESEALLGYLRTGDDSLLEKVVVDRDFFSWWEELSVNLPSELSYRLRATVGTPAPARAQRKKTLALVAKLRREKPPDYETAVLIAQLVTQLEYRARGPAHQGEMADRRGLSRWAKRLTGSYCDAEVAAFLTAARRQCGYQKPRVSAAALKQDRRRNPRQYSLKP